MRLKLFVDTLGKTFLDLLYPTRCVGCGKIGRWWCVNCQELPTFLEAQICPKCRQVSFGGFAHKYCATRETPERLISVFPYRGPIKKAIAQFKYRHVIGVSDFITAAMVDYFEKYLIYFPSDFVLVPVPLHWWRRWGRTFNQSDIIASKLGKKLGLSTNSTFLRRRRFTVSQTRLAHKERLQSVRGVFAVLKKAEDKVEGKNIVLVDDVWTSGATALEAVRTLKKARAGNVWILTVARG